MKVSDVIRKCSDEEMAKIIGAVVAMNVDGISAEEAIELEYSQTLKILQSEIETNVKKEEKQNER